MSGNGSEAAAIETRVGEEEAGGTVDRIEGEVREDTGEQLSEPIPPTAITTARIPSRSAAR